MIHELSKPYEFEGKTYDKIEADLDKASGWIMEKANRLYRRGGGTATVPYFEGEWCVLVLHELTDLPLEFFKGLPAKDYCEITLQVSNFFVG